jgi:hypothetical protein
MKLLEKLAHESWKSRDDWSNHLDAAHIEGFEEGFRKAREMAIKLWEHKDHTYCDFYSDGRELLDKMGEDKA